MFQATEITAGSQRPAIMHAYGGAKVRMERSLASIAAEGWIPMAAAMLGTHLFPMISGAKLLLLMFSVCVALILHPLTLVEQ